MHGDAKGPGLFTNFCRRTAGRSHSTFFWPKLKSHGVDRVKRWTKRLRKQSQGRGIFSLDQLFIPIHAPGHWLLGVVNFNKRRFEYVPPRKAYFQRGHSTMHALAKVGLGSNLMPRLCNSCLLCRMCESIAWCLGALRYAALISYHHHWAMAVAVCRIYDSCASHATVHSNEFFARIG